MKKSSAITIIMLAVVLFIIQTGCPRQAGAGEDAGKGNGKHPILFYIPNRVFELLDIFRLRLRLGPGLSAGVSATKVASVFVGAHSTVYAGLRGARGKPEIPWPIGLDARGGAAVSLADATASNVYNDPLGVGFEVQLGIIGISFAIECYEILDLVTGFFFIDLAKDDF